MNVLNLLDEDNGDDTILSQLSDKVTVCIENQVNLRSRIDECIFRLKAIESDLLEVKTFLNEEMNRKATCTEGKKRKSNSIVDINMVCVNTDCIQAKPSKAKPPVDIIKWMEVSKRYRSSSVLQEGSSSDRFSSGDFVLNTNLKEDNVGKVAKVTKKAVFVYTRPDSIAQSLWKIEDVKEFDVNKM